MDFKSNFESWKETIAKFCNSDVKLPNQSIDECTANAETLAKEATKDKELLGQAGLDITLIDQLVPLSGALRYCQAQWMSEYKEQKAAQQEWLEKSPLAYDLRNELLHHLTYAYRNNDNLSKKVKRIREGNGHKDMIQDLIDLAILGENNPEPLNAINLNPEIITTAKATSSEMSVLLAMVNGSKDDNSNTKALRDKAYTLLINNMSTIRECGRYVFWHNEDRREKYLN
ncbi:hypothetical protein [Ancylomarina longa]|uniref:Uncharacterized protein n=1 Tax=Ancylomarina longa TaxID=2487017 RepID=A0A434AV83_9BACT|nr:hypothetical protein [Ancylomarina longa]RUT78269.1 hypothetical protein DLK05_09345 [Ancylomarina longa]